MIYGATSCCSAGRDGTAFPFPEVPNKSWEQGRKEKPMSKGFTLSAVIMKAKHTIVLKNIFRLKGQSIKIHF